MYQPSRGHLANLSQRIFGTEGNKKATLCVRFESSDDPEEWEDEWKRDSRASWGFFRPGNESNPRRTPRYVKRNLLIFTSLDSRYFRSSAKGTINDLYVVLPPSPLSRVRVDNSHQLV